MTLLYLARHADHDYVGKGLAGRLHTPLNAVGQAQAERLGHWFAKQCAGQPVTALWSSPLLRTRQTAAPIARGLGLETRTADALLEVEFGAWTGRSFDDLDSDPEWKHWNAVRSLVRPPGGESMVDVQARMVGFINGLVDQDRQGTYILVGHADPIRAALAYYLGLPLDLFVRFEVSPASITVLSIDGWTPKVLRLNGTFDDGSIAQPS